MSAQIDASRFGLSEDVLSSILDVLTQYQQVEAVILYGSRAKGNFRNNSDIDLTLKSRNLDYATLVKIENQLDDLLLPYEIDLSNYSDIDNAELIDHIKRVGITLYSR